MPIPVGKSDEMRKLFKDAAARTDELDASRTSSGTLSRDTAWIMSMPPQMGGDMLIVMLEGEDPVKANQMFADSQEPYDVWFKSQAGQIVGVDFNQPVPPSEHVWNWQRM
jgi:hypothetical protein